MKHLIILVALAAVACSKNDTAGKAKRLLPSGPNQHCVTESGGGYKDDTVKVSFCTDGKTLAICTDDDGCITVNLPTEAPEAAPARPLVQP